ncbi:MAG: hypothetical protein ACK515_03440 [bacterium]|jgi:hypothetical protein|nr:hypothetical protein [Betaproteobacteria bacterium]
MNVHPEKLVRERLIRRLVIIRRAVDKLAALDWTNRNGGKEIVLKVLTQDDKDWLRIARAKRDQLRAQPGGCAWESEEEYDRVERAVIEDAEPLMKQSEYQRMWNEYLQAQKQQSIARAERIRVVMFRGGAPQ